MRVTNSMLVNNFLNNLFASQSRLDKLEQQLSTGKKISQPSDDPVIAARSLKFRTNVSEVEQFDKNISDGISWVEATENAIGNVTDILHRTRELVVQGANGSLKPEDLETLAEEMKQLRNQMVSVGNTTYAGRYVFSGYKTDQPLLIADDEDDEDFGKFNISVDGDVEKIKYDIGIGDSVYINVCGGKIFNGGDNAVADSNGKLTGSSDISFPLEIDSADSNDSLTLSIDGVDVTISITNQEYADIDALAAEIETQINADPGVTDAVSVVGLGNKLQFISGTVGNDSAITVDTLNTHANTLTALGLTDAVPVQGTEVEEGDLMALMSDLKEYFEDGDSDSIRESLDDIDEQLENILGARAELGARYNRLELTAARVAADKVNFTKQLSENEDADMAEIIMQLQNEENVYKAALGGGAKIIQPSLIDFLR